MRRIDRMLELVDINNNDLHAAIPDMCKFHEIRMDFEFAVDGFIPNIEINGLYAVVTLASTQTLHGFRADNGKDTLLWRMGVTSGRLGDASRRVRGILDAYSVLDPTLDVVVVPLPSGAKLHEFTDRDKMELCLALREELLKEET